MLQIHIEQKSENKNYAARPVTIRTLKPHPNANRLKIAVVGGEDVIVDSSVQVGDKMVLFPIECKINPLFLTANSLYRPGQGENSDPKKNGMFDKHGRVRAIRLRGVVSNGFVVPLTDFAFLQAEDEDWLPELTKVECFDTINGITICEKYIIRQKNPKIQVYKRRKNLSDKIVERQWRFHYETEYLDKHLEQIQPTHRLHISYKLHGTSICAGRVLVRRFKWRPLAWLADRFLGGNERYRDVWSSRRVIKTPEYKKVEQVFYEDDIWTHVYTDLLQGKLTNGLTLYGEIVGFTPGGSYIQPDYDYGFTPPDTKEYRSGTHYGLFIYRITTTNRAGAVSEFDPFNVTEWCKQNGLQSVPLLVASKASDLVVYEPPIDEEQSVIAGATRNPLPNEDYLRLWQTQLYNYFKQNPRFYMEKRCFMCQNNVPAEGIVIRIISTHEAYKLKSKAFLLKETELLDQGESDIESGI